MGRRKTKLVVQAVNSATVTEIRSRKRVKIEDTLTVEVSEPQKQARDAIIEAAEAPATPAAKRKTLKKLKETGFSAEQLPTLQAKALKIYDQLMSLYEDPPCPLDHDSVFQLLVAVILSAQSTDKKVNEIVPPLFALAPNASAMAALDVKVIETHIRQIGLAPTKAKNTLNMAKMLVEKHGGEVPSTFQELEQLPGVGHKTASVVLAVGFKLATFPVDTHIHRLAQRWGLTVGGDVEQTEADLKTLWPESHWNALHLRLIYFGREQCAAKQHDPAGCAICSWAAVPPFDIVGGTPLKAGQRGPVKKPGAGRGAASESS